MEGCAFAFFADLVRVDLYYQKDRPSADGSADTPQGGTLTPRRVAFAAALALPDGFLGFVFEPARNQYIFMICPLRIRKRKLQLLELNCMPAQTLSYLCSTSLLLWVAFWRC